MNDFWDSYTDKNKDKDAKGIADFIYHTCLALNTHHICELGCNVGNNLQSFPPNSKVYGIDTNKHAIEIAQEKCPYPFYFETDNITHLHWAENAFDLVFTRGVLIHLTVEQVHQAIREMMRISKKYIFHLEYFGKDGAVVEYEVGLWKRNMKEYYKYLPVSIISDCDIPVEIDKDKVHFTLVKIK